MRVTDETGDGRRGAEQDELQLFASLTLDCLALSRAMLEKAGPVADEDQLELARRRRLVQQIETAIGEGWPRLG
jgi:hypothetical protein